MDKSNPYGLPGMLNGMQRLVLTEKLSVFSKKNTSRKNRNKQNIASPASHGYKIEICELSAFTGKKFIEFGPVVQIYVEFSVNY